MKEYAHQKKVSQKIRYRKERVPELRIDSFNLIWSKQVYLLSKLNIPISLERPFR